MYGTHVAPLSETRTLRSGQRSKTPAATSFIAAY